jgi:hypothetical protein
MEMGGMNSLVHGLPLMLNLKNKPYEIQDSHMMFEQLFRLELPQEICFRTGRQVAKTTTLAADGIMKSVSIPNFTSLHVTPLFEQIRRFSTMFVAPFIEQSPVRRAWLNTESVRNVLHRSFRNGSKMLFSYAFLNADRIRGIPADKMAIDEVQDMAGEHIPIIKECMSASPWELSQYTGTPKTLDNPLQMLSDESSQGEWFIPCTHCTTGGFPTWNIPSIEHHLEKMIGPWHKDISEKEPAIICYKCGGTLNPRHGRWKHRYEDRIGDFVGYHIPQIIMPMHCMDPDKWATLLWKRAGKGNTTTNMFYNEVLGESYDASAKLVSLSDLNKVSDLGPLSFERARRTMGNYRMRVLACDWGGGGEKEVSFTTIALLGLRFDGRIDVLWGKRLLTPLDHIREAAAVKWYWDKFKPHFLVHDGCGAGALRETILVQAGVPVTHVFPVEYVTSAKQGLCWHVGPTEQNPRDRYRVDKSRSLQLTCNVIKLGALHFFSPDWISKDEPGLIRDFLSLVEDKSKTRAAGEIYRIDSLLGRTDDFAQAVNIGCVCLWYVNKAYPDMADLLSIMMTEEQLAAANPEDPDWFTPNAADLEPVGV